MGDFINVFVKTAFIENMILSYFLGMCSFLAVSKKVSTALGLGAAVVFVLAVTTPVNWLLNEYVLKEGALTWASADLASIDLSFLRFIMFIAIIAAISGNQEIKAVGFWTSGTLSYARLDTVIILSSVALVIFAVIPYLSRQLDLFVFNTVQLTLLGYSSNKLKLMTLTITSLAVAATVVSIGAVAFLGLAAPFIARSLFGESMKQALSLTC